MPPDLRVTASSARLPPLDGRENGGSGLVPTKRRGLSLGFFSAELAKQALDRIGPQREVAVKWKVKRCCRASTLSR
jgi:hypothetical protein